MDPHESVKVNQPCKRLLQTSITPCLKVVEPRNQGTHPKCWLAAAALQLSSSSAVLPVPDLHPSLNPSAGLDWKVESSGPPASHCSASEGQARPFSPLPACSKACQLANQFIPMLQHSLLISERSRAPRTVKCERKSNTYLMKRA